MRIYIKPSIEVVDIVKDQLILAGSPPEYEGPFNAPAFCGDSDFSVSMPTDLELMLPLFDE